MLPSHLLLSMRTELLPFLLPGSFQQTSPGASSINCRGEIWGISCAFCFASSFSLFVMRQIIFLRCERWNCRWRNSDVIGLYRLRMLMGLATTGMESKGWRIMGRRFCTSAVFWWNPNITCHWPANVATGCSAEPAFAASDAGYVHLFLAGYCRMLLLFHKFILLIILFVKSHCSMLFLICESLKPFLCFVWGVNLSKAWMWEDGVLNWNCELTVWQYVHWTTVAYLVTVCLSLLMKCWMSFEH